MIYGNKSKIDSINGCRSDDIVLVNNAEPQQVTGHKYIVSGGHSQNPADDGLLTVNGPSHVWNVNAIDLGGAYSPTVLLHADTVIDRLIVRRPYTIRLAGGLKVGQTFNAIPLGHFVEHPGNRIISEASHTDNALLRANIVVSPKSKLSYVDKSQDFKIIFDAKPKDEGAFPNAWLTVEVLRTNNDLGPGCPIQFHVEPIAWPLKKQQQ